MIVQCLHDNMFLVSLVNRLRTTTKVFIDHDCFLDLSMNTYYVVNHIVSIFCGWHRFQSYLFRQLLSFSYNANIIAKINMTKQFHHHTIIEQHEGAYWHAGIRRIQNTRSWSLEIPDPYYFLTNCSSKTAPIFHTLMFNFIVLKTAHCPALPNKPASLVKANEAWWLGKSVMM